LVPSPKRTIAGEGARATHPRHTLDLNASGKTADTMAKRSPILLQVLWWEGLYARLASEGEPRYWAIPVRECCPKNLRGFAVRGAEADSGSRPWFWRRWQDCEGRQFLREPARVRLVPLSGPSPPARILSSVHPET